MRHGKVWAVLAIFATAGCAYSGSLKDMVGYVPPTSLPAQPKRTLVAEEREQVWEQLVNSLENSAFEIDHIDEAQSLLVARYSGDPEPYIDCGSIVTHQNGTLDQIAGSAPTVALNYELEKKPVILNRALSLDSRIIIRLSDQARGTVIQTDVTYVVTKIVDVADPSGQTKEGNRETVSFEAGNRGEFSKGTTCQPNGSLDLAILQSLPNIVGSDEIDRAALSEFETETADIESPDENKIVALAETNELISPESAFIDDEDAETTLRDAEQLDAAALPESSSSEPIYDWDWVLPEQGLPTAALPSRDRTDDEDLPATTAPDNVLEAEPAKNVVGDVATLAPKDGSFDQPIADENSPTTIVDETTRKLLTSLDCAGDEWHFCDLVEITTPYRKRNIERLFGLTVNTTESFASQVIGRDLKLDILFPSFPSHLHIVYARRDGTMDHVMTTSEIWPPDLAHQLTQSGKTIPGPPGLAMIIAIATEDPLFDDVPNEAEDAATYIDRLKQRLSELETGSSVEPIAASQLLIFVENAEG